MNLATAWSKRMNVLMGMRILTGQMIGFQSVMDRSDVTRACHVHSQLNQMRRAQKKKRSGAVKNKSMVSLKRSGNLA